MHLHFEGVQALWSAGFVGGVLIQEFLGLTASLGIHVEITFMLHGENLVKTCGFIFIFFGDLVESGAAFPVGVDEGGDLRGNVLIFTRLESLVLTAGALPSPGIHRHIWASRILVVILPFFADSCNHQK